MKPGPAISTEVTWAGGSAVSCSARAPARARGLVPARLAVAMATLVDQSPCSRRTGRSRCTEVGSTWRSRPSRWERESRAWLTAAARRSRVDMVVRGYAVNRARWHVPAGRSRSAALQLALRSGGSSSGHAGIPHDMPP